MAQFSKSKKILSLTVILAIFPLAPQVNANEALVSNNNRYYCGNSEIKNSNSDRKCQSILRKLNLISSAKDLKSIFEPKINVLKYHKTVSKNTGIADYLTSSVLGVYFPTLETLNAHSGGSFFGGIKLKDNISLDAEVVGIFKGNSLEKNYFDLSTFLSLRFALPLSSKPNYPQLYFSPGIGISELDDRYTKQDDEDTRPTWQVETGVAVPIHDSLGGYGGIKYVNQLSKEGNGFLGAECGITLKL